MKLCTSTRRSIGGLLALTLLLTACGEAAEEATPTVDVEQIRTEAVATFSAGLTATALALPSSTPTGTPTPSPSGSTPQVTATAAATAVATVSSCYGLTYVSDVTVPDNTTITPGNQFTKTWRVRNSGSCAWQAGFTLRFTGGEAMGGSSVSLQNAVQPGNTADISVALTAPTTAGTYRGNWRMTDASGRYFGDEVYLLIIVGSATATSTVGASATPTPTPTLTPTPTSTEGAPS
jgi:hypothetical protein